MSPGLYLVLTSDVALLYRLCDVFLVWFRGSGFQIRASPATLVAVSLVIQVVLFLILMANRQWGHWTCV